MADDTDWGSLVAQAQAPQAAPETEDPYAGAVRAASDLDAAQAQGVVWAARASDPDKAARALTLSQQFGVPQPAIEADLPTWDQRARLLDANQALRANPLLTDWLLANPIAPKLASDDYQNLGLVGRRAADFARGWSDATAGNALGRLRFDGSDPAQQGVLEQQLAQPEPGGIAPWITRQMGGMAGGFLDQAEAAAPLTAAGAALGSALPGVGTLAGMGTGFLAGMVADGARIGYANAKRSLQQQTDAAGNSLDPALVEGASLVAGIAQGAANLYGAKAGVGGAVQEGTTLLAEALNRAITRPSVAQAVTRMGAGVMQSGLQGAAVGLGTEGATVLAEQFARGLSDGQFTTVFDDETQREQVIERLADSMGSMAVGMASLHMIPGVARLGSDLLRARQASDNAALYSGLMDSAADSKVRGRSAGLFQDWLRRQTDGTPAEHLFIPGEKVSELYQSLGQEPGPGDALFGQFTPDIAQQMEQARATGGDVVVPTAGFAAHMAGTDVERGLRGDIRVTPDGMSLNEAQQFQSDYQGALEANAADLESGHAEDQQARAPEQKVFDDVNTQARAAGFNADVSRQYAALFSARYAARGARMGMDPFDLYSDENLRIQQDVPASLRAATPDGLDMLIGDLRSKRAQPTDAALMGPSLMQFLAKRGGVIDDGGDFAAMGADRWHEGSPGTPRFIRPADDKGAALPGIAAGEGDRSRFGADAATLAAWEAGYLGDGEARPDIAALHEAVRREGAGQPVYAARNLDHAAIARRDAAADLGRTLDGMGVDWKRASPADIRAALDKRLAEPAGAELGQPDVAGAPERRGSIRLSDSGALITLFAKRDLSTLLHEAGHLFLDELVRDAARPDAPQQIRDDLATALKSFGIERSDQLATEHHEQFARAFEAYLMEGKAPSAALAGPFARFRAWLVSIYRSVASLGAEVSPPMREVFDRLLATDAQIAEARRAAGLEQTFRTAQDAGMTDAEFAAYTKAVAGARTTAEDAVLKRTMADIARRKTEWWKAEAAPIRDEVTRATDAKPEFAALHVLRTGKLPGVEGNAVPMKLDREAIVRMMGSESALDMLPKSVPPIYKDGGVHPDTVAELVGLRSGEDLIRKLMSVEARRQELRAQGDARSVRQHEIDTEVNARMTARHGDVLSDGSIQAEAVDAVHSEQQMRVLATELRALGREPSGTRVAGKRVLTGRVTPLEVVRRWAERAIGDKAVREATDTALYARAEAKAGRDALAAVLKGDRGAAFRAKQQQLLNHALFVEATRAGRDVDRAVRLLSRYADSKTLAGMAQGDLDQIHGLLERFDFSPASEGALGKRDSLREWVEQQRAKGFDPPVPDKLLDAAFATHYSRLSVNDMRGLYDSVRSIAHIGRLRQKLIDRKEAREFDALVGEAVDTAGKLPQQAVSDVRNPLAAGRGAAEKLRATVAVSKHALKSMDAGLLKIEQVMQWLDHKNPDGVFNRVVFRRLADAETHENDLLTSTAAQFRALGKAMPDATRRALGERVTAHELTDSRTGQPSSMLKSEVLALALNTGNESNYAKLLEGEKWQPEAVQAALDRLMSKADWDHVQGIWDMLEGFWPQIEALEKRINGVAPEHIQPRTVETRFGSYRGGYYPVVYDPTRGFRAEQNIQRERAGLFENNYVRATTPKGHTIERTGFAAPLYLSLDVLPRHLNQVIHDLAFREAVMDADRFLTDKRVRNAVESSLGREVYGQFRPWLQGIANDRAYDPRGLAWWDKAAHAARVNATIVGLGFRLSTMLVHGTGAALNSIGEVGARPMLAAVNTFLAHPVSTRDFVFEKSGAMRNRMDNVDRDIRDGLRELVGQSGALPAVRRFAMQGIGMLDMASALPTWLAAYQRALRGGAEDADAVYAADQVVRNAHGSGGTKDLSAAQRGTEFFKLFTMFYSFWNHLYNRQRDLYRDAGQMRSAGDFASVLGRSFFLFMAPAVMHGLFAGGGNPNADEAQQESWGAWAARHLLLGMVGGIPLVRDIVGAATEGRDYKVTPAAEAVTQGLSLAKDAERAMGMAQGDPSEHWLRHAIETPGYALGLPTGQAAGSAQFLWDVWDGREDPQGVADWLRGVMYGPKPGTR